MMGWPERRPARPAVDGGHVLTAAADGTYRIRTQMECPLGHCGLAALARAPEAAAWAAAAVARGE